MKALQRISINEQKANVQIQDIGKHKLIMANKKQIDNKTCNTLIQQLAQTKMAMANISASDKRQVSTAKAKLKRTSPPNGTTSRDAAT